MSQILEKLNEMGYQLPEPVKPVANYIPAKQVNDMVYTSGNLPIEAGELVYKGEVGGLFNDINYGQNAARICILNALSSINDLVGSLDNIKQIVKVTGFINSADMFFDQAKVMNGASDFIVELFGKEKGSHVRSAIGVNELPLNASVEIELIVQV